MFKTHSNAFKNISLFIFCGAVLGGGVYPVFLMTENATLLNRIYGGAVIFVPWACIAGIFYGLAIIMEMLNRFRV